MTAGIDIGGTEVKAALVGRSGNIVHLARWPFADTPDAQSCLRRAAAELGTPRAVGIGVPGVVDGDGTVRFAGGLGWRDVPLRSMAADLFGVPVAVDIDTNAGAMADVRFGSASGDVLYVSWGTGIGAAFVTGAKPYRSRLGAMGNLGHSQAKPDSDAECYCGVRGCLEVEAGGRAIERRTGRSVLHVTEAAANGDESARQVLEDCATLMARTIASVAAFLNPSCIVFGGGVSGCLDVVRSRFDAEFERSSPSFTRAGLTILRSKFGANAGVIGACVLPEVAA